MILRTLVFLTVFSALLGGAHWYVHARLVRDAALPAALRPVAGWALVVMFVVMLAGFTSFRFAPRAIAAPFAWVGYTWLGVVFFLVLTLAISDLARVVTVRLKDGPGPIAPERRVALARLFGGAAAVFGVGASGVGLASALGPVAVKRVRVVLDRLGVGASGTRIVQLSDVHVGPTIGKEFIADVVARVNALSPDVVVITGDLVDGTVEELREHVAPLAELRAKHGVYFVTGNHEYYSGAEAWIRHVRALGMTVLMNEHVRIGGDEGFDLAGIDDHNANPDLARALAGRDPSRACVLLAHQPRGIDVAERLGVDLQLSGHTHGGQLFPWNFLVRLQQPFVAGLHRLERAQIYVSRGTGYWGPPMRVGAPAEITEIEIVRG